MITLLRLVLLSGLRLIATEKYEHNKISFANEIAMYPWTSLKQVDDPNDFLHFFFRCPLSSFR